MSLLPEHIPEYEENRGATFSDAVLGGDGCVYGIPYCSRRFVRPDPKDDSIREYGPDLVYDLGFGATQMRYGVLAKDGFICVVQFGSASMLKVDTNEGESNASVDFFELEYLEELGLPSSPSSGILGPDGSNGPAV